MDFLSNASYSGYGNHIQKDILQENVRFEQCDWTWHVDLLSGWRNKEPAWDLIGQDNHWEVPKRPRINTRTPPLLTLLTSPRALSLSPEKWTLSLFSSGPHPASCYHDEKKSHLVFTSFYSLTLVYFLSVSSCAKLRLPNTTSPRLCKTSQRPLQRLLNSKPISDFGETLSWKDGEQRESFKHKSYASTNPRLCCNWCNIENRF